MAGRVLVSTIHEKRDIDMQAHAHPRRTRAAIAGLATLTLAATASAALAAETSANQQVALVNGTGAQLAHKSHLNGTAQVVSDNGQFMVFATDAPLVEADTNEVEDIYLRDAGDPDLTILVSAKNGVVGNDISAEPTISADGRYIAFTTWATNLTPDENGSTLDVVVKDMQQDRIVLASVTSKEKQKGGNAFFPVISDDGSAVSFQTFSRLGPRDEDRKEDVYVRDLVAGVTRQGSLLPGGGGDVRGSVLNGDLSADGDVVVFGNANNLWARNVRTKQTIRFWQEPDSPPCQSFPMGSAGRPAISGNGRWAAFASCATDLPREDGQATDVYKINLETGRIVRVHRAGNGNSYLPSLSRTGRFVGFGSEASNLVAGDTATPDAFVVDTRTGTVTRVSQGPDGAGGNEASARNDVAISSDGRTLAYTSYADNLVEGDQFDLEEVFVWRR